MASVTFVAIASARAFAPSVPIWFPIHIIRYSNTNQPACTVKVQLREHRVGLECVREGLCTVGTDLVVYTSTVTATPIN